MAGQPVRLQTRHSMRRSCLGSQEAGRPADCGRPAAQLASGSDERLGATRQQNSSSAIVDLETRLKASSAKVDFMPTANLCDSFPAAALTLDRWSRGSCCSTKLWLALLHAAETVARKPPLECLAADRQKQHSNVAGEKAAEHRSPAPLACTASSRSTAIPKGYWSRTMGLPVYEICLDLRTRDTEDQTFEARQH